MLLQADVAPYNPVRMPYSAPYGLSLALSRPVHGGRHRVSPEYEAKTDRPIMARFAPYGLRRFSLGMSSVASTVESKNGSRLTKPSFDAA